MRTRKGQGIVASLCVTGLLAGAAAGSCSAATKANSTFNGQRAFDDLKTLVAFGPRPSGSPALVKTRQWIISELKKTGASVEEDRFVAPTPIGQLAMSNILVKIPGQRPDVMMVGGHYDTARIPGIAFLGANDGGSSAAVLMELARVLQARKNRFTIWLVFFDGEEAAQSWSAMDSLYGSRHLVQKLSANGDLGRVQAMLLVDMVGDSNLNIRRESNSTRWLSDMVFESAAALGYSRQFLKGERAVDDDHIPFLNAGVAVVDLIDFDYGPGNRYWHSAHDTVEHCSPESLAIVGRVILATLERLEESPRFK